MAAYGSCRLRSDAFMKSSSCRPCASVRMPGRPLRRGGVRGPVHAVWIWRGVLPMCAAIFSYFQPAERSVCAWMRSSRVMCRRRGGGVDGRAGDCGAWACSCSSSCSCPGAWACSCPSWCACCCCCCSCGCGSGSAEPAAESGAVCCCCCCEAGGRG